MDCLLLSGLVRRPNAIAYRLVPYCLGTSPPASLPQRRVASSCLDERAVAALADVARAQVAAGGLKLLGSDGLLQGNTKPHQAAGHASFPPTPAARWGNRHIRPHSQ
jgi:hypothetical protein